MNWTIAVLPAEIEILRKEGADRLFLDGAGRRYGKPVDPFVPVRRGTSLLRLRRRSDGACGFLSPEGRCRIHEELGAKQKPLTCRAFPFHVHAVEGGPVITTSYSCPTVARNKGISLEEQSRDIKLLVDEWRRAFPEQERRLLFERGRPIAPPTLEALATILFESLALQTEEDPRPAVARMAAILDDLCRARVARLAPDRFAEYLELTGRYAVRSGKQAPARAPSGMDHMLAHGFFFTVASMKLRQERGARSLIGRSIRSARLLAHVHGLGPPVGGVDMRRARLAKWPPRDNPVWLIVRSYLTSALATLGTGRWPVVQEMGVLFSILNAALMVAALVAEADMIDEEAFVRGLNEAADVLHAGAGFTGSLIGILGGGTGALDGFVGSAAR